MQHGSHLESDGVGAVVVAAGAGSRLGGDIPKGFVPLGDTPLFVHSLRVLTKHPMVGSTVLVVPGALLDRARGICADLRFDTIVMEGGDVRWISARNGVRACPDTCRWVLIHDAARPFVTPVIIDNLLTMRTTYACAFTATPEVDTVRRVQGDRAGETVDRSSLVRVGTPQLFDRAMLLEAFELAGSLERPPTDEIMLMQRHGHAAGAAWGDPLNFKITTGEDFKIAEAIVRHHPEMLLGGN